MRRPYLQLDTPIKIYAFIHPRNREGGRAFNVQNAPEKETPQSIVCARCSTPSDKKTKGTGVCPLPSNKKSLKMPHPSVLMPPDIKNQVSLNQAVFYWCYPP